MFVTSTFYSNRYALYRDWYDYFNYTQKNISNIKIEKKIKSGDTSGKSKVECFHY